MLSPSLEIVRLKAQGAQLIEALGPCSREFVQELRERFALALARLCLAIERLKRARIAVFENPFCASHPIRTLAVNQVANDVEDGPTIASLIPVSPSFG